MANEIEGGVLWSSDDIVAFCPICSAFAIVKLTPRLRAKQPDDTTHVCHPGFGGCNHGFALDAQEEQRAQRFAAVA